MSVIDIREENSEIQYILFADKSPDCYTLALFNGVVNIESANMGLKVKSNKDAANLIKALQKAIELGWWQDSQ